MPNGSELINQLTYKAQIKSRSDRSWQEFTAEKVFELATMSADHEKRIVTLEERDRKAFGISGGIGGIIGAALIALTNYLLNRR